ncbi:MAG: tetratricopeptide (TPR) repeat protein [Verrucomicrobiales bacterium]|jgi:tetratricopeptide (TPR) repeat protein
MLRESNQLEEAEATFRKALPIYDEILSLHSNDVNFINNLANFRNNIGSLSESQEDYESASASFQDAVTLREKILGKKPKWGIVRFGKAVAKANHCRLLTRMGQIEKVSKR